jgi:hypothetical protein
MQTILFFLLTPYTNVLQASLATIKQNFLAGNPMKQATG